MATFAGCLAVVSFGARAQPAPPAPQINPGLINNQNQ